MRGKKNQWHRLILMPRRRIFVSASLRLAPPSSLVILFFTSADANALPPYALSTRERETKLSLSLSLTRVHKLPVLRTWWILPGTSSALKRAGRAAALCGTWRSPMQSTSTMVHGEKREKQRARGNERKREEEGKGKGNRKVGRRKKLESVLLDDTFLFPRPQPPFVVVDPPSALFDYPAQNPRRCSAGPMPAREASP